MNVFLKYLCLHVALSVNEYAIAQVNFRVLDSLKRSESFANLENDTLRSEMRAFITSQSEIRKEGLASAVLEEIPFQGCTDSMIIFEKSNIVSISKSIVIRIVGFIPAHHELSLNSQDGSVLLIDSFPLWGAAGVMPQKTLTIQALHEKYLIVFPKAAFRGIYEPSLCKATPADLKGKAGLSDFKVFQSKDKRRIYIYMIGGNEGERYEATWIVKNSSYYTRVVDKL